MVVVRFAGVVDDTKSRIVSVYLWNVLSVILVPGVVVGVNVDVGFGPR